MYVTYKSVLGKINKLQNKTKKLLPCICTLRISCLNKHLIILIFHILSLRIYCLNTHPTILLLCICTLIISCLNKHLTILILRISPVLINT